MAKKTDPDDVTLYDLDPKFQDRLLKWLTKEPNTIVELGPLADGGFAFAIFNGKSFEAPDFETGLCEAMGARYKQRLVNPEFSERVHECLSEYGATLTIGAATKGPPVFSVLVSNAEARGGDLDEDFEIALVLAEDKFVAALPQHRMPSDEREALEQALVPPAQREEESDDRQERLRRAFMEPRAELLENRQTVSYQRWCHEVDEQLAAVGARRQDSEYWRRLYQAGFTPAEAMVEFGAGVTDRAQWLRSEEPSPRPRRTMPTDPVELAYLENPQVLESRSRRAPPPPPRRMASRAAQEHGLPRVQRMSREYDERPFDPEAEREHYASAHHFAVNTRR
jgi:hypothetical protein